MRVLLLHNIVNPHMTPVFRELAQRVDLTVAYFAESEGDRNWRSEESGFRRVLLPGRELKLNLAFDTYSIHLNPGLWRFLREEKWDVLVNAGWASPSNWLAHAAARRLGRPHVLWSGSTVHERSWVRTLTLPLVRHIVRNSQTHVSYGTAASRYLESLGAPRGTVIPAYHCIDNDTFDRQLADEREHAAELRRSLGLDGKRVVLFVGRLWARKGADLLIRAFAETRRAVPDAALVLAGGGPLLDEYQKIAGPGVHLVGHVELNRLPAYYQLADLFVLPSHEEVWGLVLNEAALASLPLCATDVCGAALDLIREGENGLRVPAGDEARLARAMSEILGDPERGRQMGRSSRQLVTSLCTPRGVAAALERACVEASRNNSG